MNKMLQIEHFDINKISTYYSAGFTKYIFLIVVIIYFSILVRLARSQNNGATTDDLFVFIKPSDETKEVDKNWFFNNMSNFANNMAGKFSSDDNDPNIIKIWMIYIILGLFVGLILINLYQGITNMSTSIKSFSSERFYECFAIAFIFSMNILISTHIKSEPKYHIAMIGFIYIFFMAFQLSSPTIESDKSTYNLTIGLIIIPIIGSLISKIYYWSHVKSIITIFSEELLKNVFLTSINIGTTNIIINSILNKSSQTLKNKQLIYLNILMTHFIMNMLSNPDSGLF